MASFDTGWITATQACVSINTIDPETATASALQTVTFYVNISGATISAVNVDDGGGDVVATVTGTTDPVLGTQYTVDLDGYATPGYYETTITVTDSNTVNHVFTFTFIAT